MSNYSIILQHKVHGKRFKAINIENFTWYTSYAEFKIKKGVLMNSKAYCGKRHCAKIEKKNVKECKKNALKNL